MIANKDILRGIYPFSVKTCCFDFRRKPSQRGMKVELAKILFTYICIILLKIVTKKNYKSHFFQRETMADNDIYFQEDVKEEEEEIAEDM